MELTGYSDPKYLARLFRRSFGVTAKEALIKARIEALFDCTKQNPNRKNYCSGKNMAYHMR